MRICLIIIIKKVHLGAKVLTENKSFITNYLCQPFFTRGTHQFDLFCTSTIFISSTFSVIQPGSTHRLYFDLNLTSSFLAKLYFDLNLTLSFLAKLYFDQNCTSPPIRSPDLTKGRSKEGEVRESKYRTGRRYENGWSTEKVELMRTQNPEPQFHFYFGRRTKTKPYIWKKRIWKLSGRSNLPQFFFQFFFTFFFSLFFILFQIEMTV